MSSLNTPFILTQIEGRKLETLESFDIYVEYGYGDVN